MDDLDSSSVGNPQRRLDRRSFIKLCGVAAAILALPKTEIAHLARALAASPRVPVVWLEFQDCTADSESFLRASTRPDPLQSGKTEPSLADLLFDVISVEYHETLMVPSGTMAEKSRLDVISKYSGQYVCIVEGGIPTASNGIYCTIGGKTALSIAQETLQNAKATIAVGTCALDGGLPGALPNPTGAKGVRDLFPNLPNFVSLSGCPMNVVNLTAVVAYFVTYGRMPDKDTLGRPSFAYSQEIHEVCERHQYAEHDQYVLAWGDQGHLNGWCLMKMGCRGPQTHSNCPIVGWNDGTCSPIQAGHGCIGCTNSHYWDTCTPFYQARDD